MSRVSLWDGAGACLRVEVFTILVTLPQKLTEQRLPVFSHEIVPDYLRTKPDPEVEEQEKQLSAEAARMGVEVAQVGAALCSPNGAGSRPGGLPLRHLRRRSAPVHP